MDVGDLVVIRSSVVQHHSSGGRQLSEFRPLLVHSSDGLISLSFPDTVNEGSSIKCALGMGKLNVSDRIDLPVI